MCIFYVFIFFLSFFNFIFFIMNTNLSLRPLHLRILFPHLLTLSKSNPKRYRAPKDITHSKAIDLELYTYFALLLRDFIHPWYRMVTTDEDLSAEILDILILLVQKLEKRLSEEVKKSACYKIQEPKKKKNLLLNI